MMNEVYLITNRINGKRYVGITCRGYLVRFKEHILEANGGSKSILHNAIRKYGAENFDVICLESDIPDNEIENKERYYISLYHTFYTSGIGYNMTEGGGGVCGYKHSSTSREQISNSLKGHVFPKSRNAKIKAAMTGRYYKDEWKQALSESRKGKYTAEENAFYGKHHSDDTKAIISAHNTKHHIIQIDKDTDEIIQVFFNGKAAGEWLVANGYSTAQPSTCDGRIQEVCRSGNKHSTAYGFKWAYEEGQSTKS